MSSNNGVRGLFLVLPWALLLLVADVALSLLLPLSLFAPSLVYHLASRAAYPVWALIQSLFTVVNGARIHIGQTSSVIPQGESGLVVANHIAWTDFYMIQALAMRAGMLSRCRWFAKVQLRWVPLLGWGLWAMGMPLVTRNWARDRAEMERVFGGIKSHRWPIWLIAYSEATRFTTKKHADTVRWAEANGRRPPQHTLWPRYRGFVAAVGQLREARQVRAVYDITIAYAARASPSQAQGKGKGQGEWHWMVPPSMWETLSAPRLQDRYRFYVDVQRFDLHDLPEDEGELRTWLEDRWVAKDKRLEELKKGMERGLWDGKPIDEV